MIKRIDFSQRDKVADFLSADPIKNVYGLSYIEGFPGDDLFYSLFELDFGYAVQMGTSLHIYGSCAGGELYSFCLLSGIKNIFSYSMRLADCKELSVLSANKAFDTVSDNCNADIKDVYSLLKECFNNIPQYDIFQNTLTEQRCYLGGSVFGVYDDKLISTASVLMQNSLSALIGAVATKPSFRGMGYGTRAVLKACSTIKNKPIVVFSSNSIAIDMYKKLWFTNNGKVYYKEI